MSVKSLKGTVVNRAMPCLHGGSLKITLNSPVICVQFFILSTFLILKLNFLKEITYVQLSFMPHLSRGVLKGWAPPPQISDKPHLTNSWVAPAPHSPKLQHKLRNVQLQTSSLILGFQNTNTAWNQNTANPGSTLNIGNSAQDYQEQGTIIEAKYS